MDNKEECKDLVCKIKKKWYKTKSSIVNFIAFILTLIAIVAEEIKELITGHIDYFKNSGIDIKYILYLITLLCAVNVFLKFKNRNK